MVRKLLNQRSIVAGILLTAMVTLSFSECYADSNGLHKANEENTKANKASDWVWAEIKDNVTADMKTDPKDDFHLYVNKDWILENDIPEGYSSYSQYMARQDDVDKEFMDLLQDETLTSDLAKKVQGAYKTALDWDSRNELGFEPLEKSLDEIDSIQTIDDYFDYITDVSDGYRAQLFDYSVSTDLEDSSQYIFYLSQKTLLLGDAAEYAERTSNGQLRYDAKLQVLEYMLPKLGIDKKEAKKMLNRAIEFESELAEVSYTVEEQYDSGIIDKCLNKMSAGEACELCKNYPMMDFLKSIDMDTADVIDVENPKYFEKLGSVVTEENLEVIKDLYKISVILESYTTLDEETYRDCTDIINSCFGVEGNVPDEQMAADFVKKIMPIECQQLYAEEYGTEEKRKLVTDMCQQVIDTYAEMLKENDYLSSDTIDKAIEKLNAISIHSLYPDKWPDVSNYDIEGLSVYDMSAAWENFQTEYNLSKAGTEVDKDLWIDIGGGTILECNAFYSPTDNSINMIFGMMGEPFYSDDMSVEGIYASLGAFWIGHEVSHAFDSNGSQYDKDGNYKNWWTDADRKAFDERIEKVDQYLSAINVEGEYYVKGSNVDTEMVADYTGLQCALKMAEEIENFDYKEFFEVYGNMNVSIETKEGEISQLLTDSHPLNYLRTNIPVQQFEEFYDTYDVKEGDGMYLAPEDRLLVW